MIRGQSSRVLGDLRNTHPMTITLLLSRVRQPKYYFLKSFKTEKEMFFLGISR